MMLELVTALLPQSPVAGPRDLEALLRADGRTAPIVAKAAEHRLQVLLAEPVTQPDGRVTLVRSRLGDAGRYFYPASSIKLCGAVAALVTLNEHNRAHGTSLGLDSALVVEPRFDGDVRVTVDPRNVDGGRLTVRSALRKLLLVSDNQAYNHLFELCGQDGLNRRMWDAGFTSARLWHRLSESRTLAENRVTRALRVGDVEFPARDAGVELSNEAFADRQLGAGYMIDNLQVDGPMVFDHKNAILLQDLQDVLVEVLRPEVETGRRGFPELNLEQRAFLTDVLGQFPRESTNPVLDPEEVPDHYCKWVLRGVRRVVGPEHARVYDKTGRAYGFSIENAYVEDRSTGRGFFLAIVVYTNPNAVLNDDCYEYEQLADPFLNAVGEILAAAVL